MLHSAAHQVTSVSPTTRVQRESELSVCFPKVGLDPPATFAYSWLPSLLMDSRLPGSLGTFFFGHHLVSLLSIMVDFFPVLSRYKSSAVEQTCK